MPAFLNGVATKEKQSCHKEGEKRSSKVREKIYRSSRLRGSSATIKEHISTRIVVRPLTVMSSKHVLIPHRTHTFIVDVQPTLSTATVCVRVEHVNRIMPSTCRPAVVVEHSIERVLCRQRWLSGTGCHYVWTNQPAINSQHLTEAGGKKGEEKKPVPSGISSSGENWTGLPILTTPPVAPSYKNRFRWRTSTGGSASMSTVTCWFALLGPDGLTCTDWGCEMWASASWMLCIESGCRKSLGVSH